MQRPSALETILFVRDLDEARGFYGELIGLPVVYESDWFLSFEVCEGVFLSLNARRDDYQEHGTQGRGVKVELRVPDVDAAWGSLAGMGVPFDFPPEDKPWGLRSCGTRDPEGYAVWLSSVIEGVRG